MNPSRLRKAPNIAIVGSSSPLGKELKEILDELGFPVGKLTLLETEEYAGLLQEFAGAIAITEVVSPAAFENVDIAFFACGPEIITAYAATGAAFPELTIDLTGAGRQGVVFVSGVSSPTALTPAGYFVNPHPAAIALARVLGALDRGFGLATSFATILEPASERGSAAVEELQEQTVSLLNLRIVFSSGPPKVSARGLPDVPWHCARAGWPIPCRSRDVEFSGPGPLVRASFSERGGGNKPGVVWDALADERVPTAPAGR